MCLDSARRALCQLFLTGIEPACAVGNGLACASAEPPDFAPAPDCFQPASSFRLQRPWRLAPGSRSLQRLIQPGFQALRLHERFSRLRQRRPCLIGLEAIIQSGAPARQIQSPLALGTALAASSAPACACCDPLC